MCCVAVKIAAIIYYAQLVRCHYSHYAHLLRSMIRVGKIGTPRSQSWTAVLSLSVPTTLLALTLRYKKRGCLGSNDTAVAWEFDTASILGVKLVGLKIRMQGKEGVKAMCPKSVINSCTRSETE